MLEREKGQGVKKPKATLNEKEWLERFTKKEEKKATYQDPHTTFKPQISKKTEKILAKNPNRNTYDELI